MHHTCPSDVMRLLVVGYSGIFVLKEKTPYVRSISGQAEKSNIATGAVSKSQPDSYQPSWFCLYTKKPNHLPAYEFHSD